MAFENEKEYEVRIPIKEEDIMLYGNLYIPQNAQGLILFAHGSGSGRFSPRNRFVAQFLNKGAYATLLFDLLTRSEEANDLVTAQLRFNIDFLAERLLSATNWVLNNDDIGEFAIGYFGASTGAAAAIVASVKEPEVKAIVSRGGRPDMAEQYLQNLEVPTLLIVGGDDYSVIDMNKNALSLIKTPAKKIEIVPGATHLFEEPGALDEVARIAVDWFIQYVH